MLDLLSTGYPSLDYICRVSHTPAMGETGLVRSPPSRYTFGGCGANVAVGLARLGFRTGVAMVVGDDGPGQAYISQLQTEGVDTRDVIRLPRSSTSESRLYVNPEGEYQNFFYPGAADGWQGELRLKSLAERWGPALQPPVRAVGSPGRNSSHLAAETRYLRLPA
jgi:sugar/nucleoside kinase (ribokinase family)